MSRIVIEANRPHGHYLSEVWRFRELLAFLAWRDILVRYKQTAIGVAWALLRPLLTILVGTGVFHGIAGLSGGTVPYAVLVCAGILPWQFFATCLGESTASLVGNAGLVTKVYFPRLLLPASTIAVALVDLAIALLILAGLMTWFEVPATWRLLALPVFILQAILAALGPGLLMTALNVRFRDFRYIVPFIIQLGLFASPVFYSLSAIESKWGGAGMILASLNPMTAVIEGFRWAVCGTPWISGTAWTTSLAVTLLGLVIGFTAFRRMEDSFADVI